MTDTTKDTMQKTANALSVKMSDAAAESAKAQEAYRRAKHSYESGFCEDWHDLGLDDDDLAALQLIIMAEPKCGILVKGTGGLRKLRFAKQGRSGKRKHVRVGYVFLEGYDMVLLVVPYTKNESDDICAADRKFYAQMIRRQKMILSKGPRK